MSSRHVTYGKRFTRYSSVSLITVPAGYILLLLARRCWDVNAGLLNLLVGTVLTGPSYLLYRSLVWTAGSRGNTLRELFGFWQTVMAGALVSTALIALVDAVWADHPLLIVAAGITGQGVVFIGRFFWLDGRVFTGTAGQ